MAAFVFCGLGCQPETPDVESDLRTQSSLVGKSTIGADDVPVLDASAVAETLNHEVRDDDWFLNITTESGVNFVHRNGRESGRYYLLESFGGGVAQVDIDHDGRNDLFLTGGGSFSNAPEPVVVTGLPPAVYRQFADFRFQSVTHQSGLQGATDYSLACSAIDSDNDGFQDVLVCSYGRTRLFRNLGDGTFDDGTSIEALGAQGMVTAAAWADVDHDSDLDLFLARYADWSPENEVKCFSGLKVRDVCGPRQYEDTQAMFFRNCGDGTFENWSLHVGLQGGVKGLGVIAGDFNLDGFADFYLANDETANHLYLGQPGGTLRECAWESGCAAGENGLEEGSMGVDAADVDGDGLPELWTVNFANEDNALYGNLGGSLFRHSTVRFGLGGQSRMNVGWGTSLTDFDSDNWPDILVINSSALYSSPGSPFLQPSQLFRNLAGQRFENVSLSGGTWFRSSHAGRGLAVGDLNEDGAVDAVIGNLNEPVAVLKNQRTPENWIRIHLAATLGTRDPVGARITMDLPDGRTLTRFFTSGAGYASSSDPRIVMALTDDSATCEVTVAWPGRAAERFSGLRPRQNHVLIEGRGHP